MDPENGGSHRERMLAGDLYIATDPELVLVLPGMTIGENTAARRGAVVTKDLAPNVVAVGNPARVVRRI